MKRIYQVAKEMGISSKAMLKLLKKLGYDAASPMAPMVKEMLDACNEYFKKDKERVKIIELEKRKIRARIPLSTYERLKEKQLREKGRAEQKIRETMTKIKMGKRTIRYKKEVKEEVVEDRSKQILLAELTSVRELADFLRTDPLDLIAKCIKLGLNVTINHRLDFETAATIASEYGYEAILSPTYEEEEVEELSEESEPRNPIVTVMGHVDHGKTTLLDYIRHTNVVETEVGRITQHIGAYKVKVKDDKYITFIDTPGHQAFTAMRTRGTKVTDIVILVVAANEGVKPQTVEAINHAKDAAVPIIVAITKSDLSEANPDEAEKQLLDYKVVTEKYGGDVPCCKVSAKTGDGVKGLLETILIMAELLELKTNTKAEAKATIIETKLDKGRGPIATAIIHQGVLKIGDPILAGNTSGKVRALFNEWGKSRSKALPSDPIQIVGFDDIPQVGDTLRVIQDEKMAREICKTRKISIRDEVAKGRKPVIEDLQLIGMEKNKELKIIIKADVAGSAEALSDMLQGLNQVENPAASGKEIKISVVHQGAGEINESDILLAAASKSMVLGFNTKENPNAYQMAKEKNVTIRTYNIIYNAMEDIQNTLNGLIPPKFEEYDIGKAEVKQVFKISGVGFIIGCLVVQGKVIRGEKIKVKREGTIVYEGIIDSLKRIKESVKEVVEGIECGIGLEESVKLEQGDIIEVYGIKEVSQTIDKTMPRK